MSKPKHIFNEQEKNLIVALYEIGCTDEEVARIIRLPYATLKDAIKSNGLTDTIKHSKGIGDKKVETSLYKQALSGNITACIFWLCNRQRDKWKQHNKELDTNQGNINVVVIKDAKPRARENQDIIEIEAGKNEDNNGN